MMRDDCSGIILVTGSLLICLSRSAWLLVMVAVVDGTLVKEMVLVVEADADAGGYYVHLAMTDVTRTGE